MRSFSKFLALCGLFVPALWAQTSTPMKATEVRFNADMLDKSVDPCTDFYSYACSKWQAKNPVPADRSTWGRFNELQERGEYIVRDILEKAAAKTTGRTPYEQKIGDYYASCMDESAIEKAGAKPLDHDLQSIDALKSKNDLAKEAMRMHREGADVMFSFSSSSDFKNASQIIAEVDQGGLGLPDRDYYFKDDAKSVELRQKYVEHVQKMFELLGDAPAKAAAEAKVVMDIETGLAKGALDQTSRRDPQKIYHKLSNQELAALSPSFNWNVYFEGVGAPKFDSLNVAEPDFVKQMQAVVDTYSLDDWKTYLRWHTVHDNVQMLPAAFVTENFNFFGWRDYSNLEIKRGDALGNSQRSNQHDLQRRLSKIGTPLDKRDWPYPPMTINASYNPLQNNITFPAGILQPPFYDNKADDAMNFGGIGAVIGHELTHGFDDEGSQFDAEGNLRDWWTATDKKQFEERTGCIKDQYGSFVAVDDLKLNGKLTLGENTADNGGMRIAYMALMSALAGKEPPPADGLTAKQRFFLGWANVWCQNRTDAMARMLVTIDPHSPGKNRVNGTVSNMPEFRDAYHCKADAPMVNQNACRVW